MSTRSPTLLSFFSSCAFSVFGHPHHTLVARMPEHALNFHHTRLLHGVTDDHAFATLPLPHLSLS